MTATLLGNGLAISVGLLDAIVRSWRSFL